MIENFIIKGYRWGSTPTSLVTSVRREVVKLQILLCLKEVNPDFGHKRECSIEKWAPQAHKDGVWRSCQLYLRDKASRKADLCSVKPNYSSGNTVNQLKIPFLETNFMAINCVDDN